MPRRVALAHAHSEVTRIQRRRFGICTGRRVSRKIIQIHRMLGTQIISVDIDQSHTVASNHIERRSKSAYTPISIVCNHILKTVNVGTIQFSGTVDLPEALHTEAADVSWTLSKDGLEGRRVTTGCRSRDHWQALFQGINFNTSFTTGTHSKARNAQIESGLLSSRSAFESLLQLIISVEKQVRLGHISLIYPGSLAHSTRGGEQRDLAHQYSIAEVVNII
jgi:hypothetical protein